MRRNDTGTDIHFDIFGARAAAPARVRRSAGGGGQTEKISNRVREMATRERIGAASSGDQEAKADGPWQSIPWPGAIFCVDQLEIWRLRSLRGRQQIFRIGGIEHFLGAGLDFQGRYKFFQRGQIGGIADTGC